MSKTTKIIVLAVVIVLILGIVYKYSNQPVKNKGVIKIGVILPLSGDVASLGEEIQKGVILGVDEANKQGWNVVPIFEDDNSLDPSKSASAANKLIAIDKADVVLTMVVEEAQPIMPIFNNQKVPLLVLWDSNKVINSAGPYIFSNGFSTERAGENMATYAFNNLHLRRIAIIAHEDVWADDIGLAFKDKFESLGGTTTYYEKFVPSVTDYRTAIAKIKQSNPDGVYFPLIPPQNARFLIQAQQLGLKVPLLTGDALVQDSIDQAGSAAEGVFFTNFYTDNAAQIDLQYQEKFKTAPFDPTLVSFGFDGVAKVVEAEPASQVSITDGFNKIFGPTHSAVRDEKIYQVVQGKPKSVQ